MGRFIRRLALVVGVVVLIGGGLVGWAYLASQQVPEFYQQALQQPPADQARKSDAFLSEATDLYSELQQPGRWEAMFTVEEINSWLAVDVVNNHAKSLPPGVSDPRVALAEGGAQLACRYESERITTVLSLQVDAYLAEPNVVGVRFRKARAGSLPLPLTDILDGLSQEAAKHEVPVRWLQADSDPVAFITLPAPNEKQKLIYSIDTLEIGPKGIYIAGTSSARVAKAPGNKPDAAQPEATK